MSYIATYDNDIFCIFGVGILTRVTSYDIDLICILYTIPCMYRMGGWCNGIHTFCSKRPTLTQWFSARDSLTRIYSLYGLRLLDFCDVTWALDHISGVFKFCTQYLLQVPLTGLWDWTQLLPSPIKPLKHLFSMNADTKLKIMVRCPWKLKSWFSFNSIMFCQNDIINQ